MDKIAGSKALAALEQALAHQPQRNDAAFSDATEHLCQLRNSLAAEPLARVNAIISAALAGHFPLGATPWPLVQTATDQLRQLLLQNPLPLAGEGLGEGGAA